jgi:hypothetical protein
MKLWVLTEDYNDYHQHGKYLLEVYTHKPCIQQIVQDARTGEHIASVVHSNG